MIIILTYSFTRHNRTNNTTERSNERNFPTMPHDDNDMFSVFFRRKRCIFIGAEGADLFPAGVETNAKGRKDAENFVIQHDGAAKLMDKPVYSGKSFKKERSRKGKRGWHAIHKDGTLRRYAYSSETETLVQCDRVFDLKIPISIERVFPGIKFTQEGKKPRTFYFNDDIKWHKAIQCEIKHWKKPDCAVTIQKMFRGFFQRKKKAQTIEYLNDVYAIRLTNDDNAEVECPIYNNAHGTLFVCQNIAESEIDDLKVSLQYAEEDIEDLNWLTSPQRYMRLANEIQTLKRRVSTPMAMGKIVLKERDALFCELSINISVTNGDYDFDLEFSEDDDGTIYCYDIDGCYWEMTLLNKNI